MCVCVCVCVHEFAFYSDTHNIPLFLLNMYCIFYESQSNHRCGIPYTYTRSTAEDPEADELDPGVAVVTNRCAMSGAAWGGAWLLVWVGIQQREREREKVRLPTRQLSCCSVPGREVLITRVRAARKRRPFISVGEKPRSC